MSAKKDYTLGVLTSGGDAPGMNACVRAVARAGFQEGVNMVGVSNGYEGLINGEFKRWRGAR